MNKHLIRLLTFAVLLTATSGLFAQVRIGGGEAPTLGAILDLNSTDKGGLLLSNVSITSLDSIPAHATVFPGITTGSAASDVNLSLAGMIVYNTNPDTGKGLYVWDGNEWMRANLGSAVVIKADPGNCNPFKADGSCTGSYTLADPSCKEHGEFVFTWVTGESFVDQFTIVDAGAGKFSVKFLPNDRAAQRQAILLATSPCGNSNSFVFTQAGDDAGCAGSTAFTIKSSNPSSSLEMCRNGAVFLYLENYPTGHFIWTLNGEQVGSGNTHVATKAGKYIVYEDKIGCPNSQSVTLTLGNNTAPASVQFIVVGNNGIACGTGGTVNLIVTQPTSGTIAWYKDGRKAATPADYTVVDGKPWHIQAKAGSWQAVTEDGACVSLPTTPVNVTEQSGGTPMTTPTMIVNGGSTAPFKLCANGSMHLEVLSPDPAASYTWYIDNTQIGIGTGIYYPVPASNMFVLRLRATGSGCAGEAFSIANIFIDSAPAAPVISINAPGDVLCGGQATLAASGSAASYHWYKNGNEITGQTGAIITVTETGAYTATAVSANLCVSQKSSEKIIAASDYATVSWVAATSHPDTVNTGGVKTYAVSLDFPIGAVYNWTLPVNSADAQITNGQGTSSISVKFNTAGNVTVQCAVSTACGNATGSPIQQAVVVANDCNDAVITDPVTAQTIDVIAGSNGPVLSITAQYAASYQWYSGESGNVSSPISGATAASYQVPDADIASAGTKKYWCRAVASGICNPDDSPTFTINITALPVATGTGTFGGRTCFDIATGNDDQNSCSSLSSRAIQKTDFTDRTQQDGATTAPYSGVQVYTFKPSGQVSKVRFNFDEVNATGLIVDSIVPQSTTYASGTNISGACKVTVYYKTSLQTSLVNVLRANALKLKLYAIYHDNAAGSGGTDRTLELNISLLDCVCCGAKTTTGDWLTFMCHNLGADESLDPFVWNNSAGDKNANNNSIPDAVAGQYKDIKGHLYQWGRFTDGHQYRNSAQNIGTRPSVSLYNAAVAD
ncbi:MAG: hypothetical protein LBC40_04090 [Dysgonamonadaceae bacterium]|jgi:hypothetical protein|nr:hypothetical protein [Dysgonamonadaceae bacterium]